MQIIILWEIRYRYESHATADINVGKVTLWIQYEIFWSLYCDHKNFGWRATWFSKTFIKTCIILRVNKHFCGKFCPPVFFNDVMFIAAIFLTMDRLWHKKQLYVKKVNNCFPFNIKILLKYNTVLLAVN